MAGTIKAGQIQLGDSATATQNFVWQTNNDGTAKLSRGNAGATTQDIVTVGANGAVTFVLSDFASDAAAATGGIAIGQLYRTAGAVKVRIV